MSISTKVIVDGTVQDIQRRTGVTAANAATGKPATPWSRTTVVVIGPATGVMAEVSFRGESESAAQGLELNKPISLLAEVGSYRDDDTIDFIKYLK